MPVNRIILDMVNASSMTNSKEVIADLFSKLKFGNSPNELYSYYQGCGFDICTLSIDNIGNHVFSDKDPSCKTAIFDQLKDFQNAHLISNLEETLNGWTLDVKGAAKKIYFTTKDISEFNFNTVYGPLALVFNYNSGDSTYRRDFWQSISKYLMIKGYVIGYNTPDITKLNRQTLFIQPKGKNYKMYDDIQDVHSNNENFQRVITYCNENEIAAVPFGTMDAPFSLITVDGKEYLIRITEYPPQMNKSEKIYSIKSLQFASLSDYSLSLIEMKNNVTLLQKR